MIPFNFFVIAPFPQLLAVFTTSLCFLPGCVANSLNTNFLSHSILFDITNRMPTVWYQPLALKQTGASVCVLDNCNVPV